MAVNSRRKAIEIKSQRKPFHRQRLPEFSCVRKKTVDIDIGMVTEKSYNLSE